MRIKAVRPHLLNCARTVCDRSWVWLDSVSRPAQQVLWLIESGEGRILLDDQPELVQAGECLLISLRQRVEGRHQMARPFVVLWALFEMRDARGRPVGECRCQKTGEPFPLRRRLPDTAFFQRLFERLIEENLPEAREDYFRALWRELNHQEGFTGGQGVEPELGRRLADLCARIREKPGRDWRVGEMAAGLHYSPDHFARLFRRLTGLRPQDYIIAQRIDAACNLLLMGNLPVTRIAQDLGYCDVYHFCRQFKRKTGRTPLQLRNRR